MANEKRAKIPRPHTLILYVSKDTRTGGQKTGTPDTQNCRQPR